MLTYGLADAGRYRVARRLDQREQACQVHEVGGGDVTAALRAGRAVMPGLAHLRIDEAVFCASACVGEDALRLGAADAPGARAADVQEAIERLADSGDATTAAQALAALNEAAARVGSERRSASPLGRAVARIRQLEVQADEARRRLAALAAEEERLGGLDAEAVAAEARRADAERTWLLGRLAAIREQRAELATVAAEVDRLAAEAEGTAHLAGFPADAEDRVILLAAEAGETRRSADEAAARAEATAATLADVRRRRAEIAAGLRALATAAAVDDEARAEAAALDRDLAATLAGRHRGDELSASLDRRDALRHEIAAAGVAGASAAGVEAALDLVATARGGRSTRTARRAATAVMVLGAAAAAVAAASHHGLAALVAAGVAVAATIGVLLVDRLVSGDADHARRRLRRLFPGVTIDAEGLDRLADRLPRLRALFAELQREELRAETLSAEVEDAGQRLHALAERAAQLVARCDLAPSRGSGRPRAEATVRAVLAAIGEAVAVDRRRGELREEDADLAHREGALASVAAEAEQRMRAADASGGRLRGILDEAGVDPALPIAQAVQLFRSCCEDRRRHEAARRRLTELQRRSALGSDEPALARLAGKLEAQLLARGGDPADVETSAPLDQARLQDLETAAEHARQGAACAATTAAALCARLAEVRAHLPILADLEDELGACLAARDRALVQLAALRRAAELIEAATRSVHRELAPRLATSVADRLALLTEGRYSAVNVDTSHFAVALRSVERPDLVPLELVSHGTRDQVSLLLRLALAEVLSGGGEPVPLLLDEPLLSADPQRRRTALSFLWGLSETNQVVLSTSDPALASDLALVCEGADPAVVALPGREPSFETTGRVAAGRALRLL